MHISALQSKPFNPIIGETCQLNIGDLKFYVELIGNKPPCFRFYGISENYKIEGYQNLEAKTGANSVKAFKSGKYKIIFKDGSSFLLYPPTLMIKGINVGKRIFYFRRACVISDEVRDLY